MASRNRAAWIGMAMVVAAIARGETPATDTLQVMPALESPSLPLMSHKYQARLVRRLDQQHLTYYLSEPGRYGQGAIEEDFREAAKSAARGILRTQIRSLRALIDPIQETAVSLRSGRAHVGDAKARSSDRPDIDVGLRGGKPFVGATLGRTRLGLEYDWRHDRGTFKASRPLGPAHAELQIRVGEEREVRLGISIPLGR